MDQRVCLVWLLFLAACSGSAARVAGPRTPLRAAISTPVSAPPGGMRVSPAPSRADGRAASNASLELGHDADPDQVFIANAERAIALYREFLARAGDDAQYAAAVKRSREQIEDLEGELEFVQSGIEERARK